MALNKHAQIVEDLTGAGTRFPRVTAGNEIEIYDDANATTLLNTIGGATTNLGSEGHFKHSSTSTATTDVAWTTIRGVNTTGKITNSGTTIDLAGGWYEVIFTADVEAPAGGDNTRLRVAVDGVSFGFVTVDEANHQTGAWSHTVDATAATVQISVNRNIVTGTGGIDCEFHIRQIVDPVAPTAVKVRYPFVFKVTAYTNDRWVGPQYAQPITEIWTTNLGTAADPAFPAQALSLMDLPSGAVVNGMEYSVTQDSATTTYPSSFEWRLAAVEKTGVGSYQGTDPTVTVGTGTVTGLPANNTESLFGVEAINATMNGVWNHLLLAVRPVGSSTNSKRLNFQMSIDVTLP